MRYVFLIALLFTLDASAQGVSVIRVNRAAEASIDALKVDADFNRSSNGIVRDHLSGADLTESTALTFIKGLHGRAAFFPGLSSHQMTSAHEIYDLPNNSDWTVEVWVRPDTIIAAAAVVYGQRNTGDAAYSFTIFDTDPGNTTVGLWPENDGAATVLQGDDATNVLVEDQWNHVVVTFDESAGEATLSINDGTATTVVLDSIDTSSDVFRLANMQTGCCPYYGAIDHLRVWHREISSSEITSFYNNGEGPLPTFHLTRKEGGAAAPTIVAPGAPTISVSTTGNTFVTLSITYGSGGTPTSCTVHYDATDNGSYANSTNVGTNTSPTISGLSESTPYFMVATCSNSAGTSGNSNEVTPTTTSSGGGTDTYDNTLRVMSCSAGVTHTLQSSDGKIDGEFLCQNSDPNGLGDDGGIVIASATGGWFWVRQWSYGPSGPIEMDWYEVVDQENVTTLLNNLATAYSPNLYLRAPSTAMTLYTARQLFNCQGTRISRFGFFESGAAVTIAHDGTGSAGSRARATMFQFASPRFNPHACTSQESWMDYFWVGSLTDKDCEGDSMCYNLTFSGETLHPFSNNGLFRLFDGMIKDNDDNPNRPSAMAFRANIVEAHQTGFGVHGWNRVTAADTFYLAGLHRNAPVAASSTADVVVLERGVSADETFRNWGWTGTCSGGTGDMNYAANGSHDGGFHVNQHGKSIGKWTFDYGGQQGGGLRQVRNWGDAGSPVEYVIRNAGYMGPSATGCECTPVTDDPGQELWFKSDPITVGSSASGERFMRITEDQTANCGVSAYKAGFKSTPRVFECTPETFGGEQWHCSNVVTELVNMSQNISVGVLANRDPSFGHSDDNEFFGNGTDPATISPSVLRLEGGTGHIVRDGEFHDVRVVCEDYDEPAGGGPKPCDGMVFRDITITNLLSIDSGSSGSTMENVRGTTGTNIHLNGASVGCSGQSNITGNNNIEDVTGATEISQGLWEICTP